MLQEEAAGHHLPTGVFTITLGMCVPVLLQHGTEEQKRRHIPPMLRADEIWCQLFSEPNAGSDIAGAQLRAIRDGDEWVLTGQKVWTSSAERAAFGMCIARTDPDVPKHRGLTMFVVPMDAPGITIRPLVQATGDAEFNEVFFDEARIPADSRARRARQGLGGHHLDADERADVARRGRRLAAQRPHRGRAARRPAPSAATARCSPICTSARRSSATSPSRSAPRAEAGREPGPGGSIAKLAGSDLVRRAATAHIHQRGAAGMAWEPDDAEAAAAARAFVHAPSLSIAGGTSEIQRNIIGERVLGLPREPEVDKGVPFRDVQQNRP